MVVGGAVGMPLLDEDAGTEPIEPDPLEAAGVAKSSLPGIVVLPVWPAGVVKPVCVNPGRCGVEPGEVDD